VTVTGIGGGDTETAAISLLVLAPPTGVTFAYQPLAGPSRLEVNLGPTPIDDYEQQNCQQYHLPGSVDSNGHDVGCDTNIQFRYLPGCSHQLTVRQCYQNALNFYAQNGVTGLRLQFAFCGGAGSTPLSAVGSNGNLLWPPCGSSSQGTIQFDPTGAWSRQLGEFFADILGSGITNITPTPAFSGFGGDNPVLGWPNGVTYTPTSLGDEFGGCSDQPAQVQWWPALPFPLKVNFKPDGTFDSAYPYLQGTNDSYNCAPANNQNFVGWGNIYSVIDHLIYAAAAAGLNIEEFDVSNEIELDSFTVLARLIVDNTHNDEGVLQHIAQAMYSRGFYDTPFNPYTDPTAPYPLDRVTFSVMDAGVTSNGKDCLSVFNDSARVLPLSNLVAALGGGFFGEATGTTSLDGTNLSCGGSQGNPLDLPGNMIQAQLPEGYPLPTIVDMHTGHCLRDAQNLGNCKVPQSEADAALEMQPVFDGANRLIQSFCPGQSRGNSPQMCNALYMQGELPIFQLAPDPNESTNGTLNPTNCEGNPIAVPGGVVQGLNASGLHGRALPSGNPGVVFRPWLAATSLWSSQADNISNRICYGFPQILKPALAPGQ